MQSFVSKMYTNHRYKCIVKMRKKAMPHSVPVIALDLKSYTSIYVGRALC